MRRQDGAGKSLDATLHGHQKVSGLSRAFTQYDTKQITYLPTNTRWKYMWQTSKQYNFQIVYNDLWLPSIERENDKAIMDSAFEDPYFVNKSWRLEIINNCRIYLVFTLSEMVDQNGSVEKGFLDGSKGLSHPKVHFEETRKPPPPAWNEWKVFLFCNFIMGHNKISPALGQTITTKNTRTSNTEQQHDEHSLQQTMGKQSTYLCELLGEIKLPTDNGKAILEEAKKGKLLGASNGSLFFTQPLAKGGYAYCIQGKNKKERAIGGRKVPLQMILPH